MNTPNVGAMPGGPPSGMSGAPSPPVGEQHQQVRCPDLPVAVEVGCTRRGRVRAGAPGVEEDQQVRLGDGAVAVEVGVALVGRAVAVDVGRAAAGDLDGIRRAVGVAIARRAEDDVDGTGDRAGRVRLEIVAVSPSPYWPTILAASPSGWPPPKHPLNPSAPTTAARG